MVEDDWRFLVLMLPFLPFPSHVWLAGKANVNAASSMGDSGIPITNLIQKTLACSSHRYYLLRACYNPNFTWFWLWKNQAKIWGFRPSLLTFFVVDLGIRVMCSCDCNAINSCRPQLLPLISLTKQWKWHVLNTRLARGHESLQCRR